jgi:dCMP deaminase
MHPPPRRRGAGPRPSHHRHRVQRGRPRPPGCLEGACPRGALDYDAVPGLGDYDRPGTPGFCIAIHAEVNALLFATRDTKGASAYITDPPCPGCRKALAAAGIVRAVWPGGDLDAHGLLDWAAG